MEKILSFIKLYFQRLLFLLEKRKNWLTFPWVIVMDVHSLNLLGVSWELTKGISGFITS